MLTGPEADTAVDSLVVCCGRGLWMFAPEPARCGCEDMVVESVVCGACDATTLPGGFAGDITGRGDICVWGDIWGGRGDIWGDSCGKGARYWGLLPCCCWVCCLVATFGRYDCCCGALAP